MKQIVLFILTFIFVFIVYQILFIGKRKRKNSKKQPMEVKYLETKYKLDLKKIRYKRLLMVISVVSSLDISIIITLALLFKSYLIELAVIIILIIPTIIVSYSFIGKHYVRKGMIKDE